MTTRQSIESITDPGLFEELCSAIIRRMRPDLSGLLQTGTNPEGQSIKSPVDGFKMISIGSETKFVSIQHTIGKDLRRKWLSSNGDIAKTEEEHSYLRETFPNATFELILTSTLVPSTEILHDVAGKAQALNLIIDILDQSRIADFLDNEPIGHWLRKKHLGINYSLFSQPVLEDLTIVDLEEYQANFSLPPISELIKRDLDLKPSSNKITLLVGRSGNGKSTIVYQLMHSLLQNKRKSLWLDAELVKASIQLENCLRERLLKLNPTLYLDNSELWLTKDIWQATTFVVDDINRISDKRPIVTKLIQWLDKTKQSSWDVSFIIPVWEEAYKLFPTDRTDIDTFFVEQYTVKECRNALADRLDSSGLNIEHFHIDSIANALGYDPLLVDLFKKSNGSLVDINSVTQNVILNYVDACVDTIASEHETVLAQEIKIALKELGDQMLEKKKLNPSYAEISVWLKNQNSLQAIKLLLKKSSLISIDINGNLKFRHDRIQDEILASFLFENLANYLSDWRYKEIHYSYLIGKALSLDDFEIHEEMFNWFLEENPIAVFEFIRCKPSKALTTKNRDAIKHWITTELNLNFNTTIDERTKALLFWTESDQVIQILPAFKTYDRTVCLTEMKNGLTPAAIKFLNHHFETLSHTHFDSIERFVVKRFQKSFRSNAIEIVATLLKGDLSRIATSRIIGALSLASLLEAKELGEIIASTSKYFLKQDATIRYCIKAYLSCGVRIKSNLWDDLMELIGSVSNNKIWHLIRQALADSERWIAPDLDYVIEKAKGNSTWAKAFQLLIEQHGSIECLDFVIDEYTKSLSIDVDQEIRDGYSQQAIRFYNFCRTWDPTKSHNRKLPTNCIEFLFELWLDERYSKPKRWFAFNIWKNYSTKADLPKIRRVGTDSFLFQSIYWLRITLDDTECISSFPINATENPKLLFISYHIWCAEVKQTLNTFLQSLKIDTFQQTSADHFIAGIARLLTEIPLQDCEDLIIANWDNIKNYGEFLRIGLYLDSNRINDLASESIENIPHRRMIFDDLHWTFGANVVGRGELITVAKLERIKPFFKDIDDLELFFLIDPKNKVTFEWWRKNIPTKALKFGGGRHFPTDDQIKRHFESYSNNIEHSLELDFFIERLNKEDIGNERILNVWYEWFRKMNTIKFNEFLVGCRVVKLIGKRDQINFLKDCLDKVDGERHIIQLNFESAKDEVFLNSLD